MDILDRFTLAQEGVINCVFKELKDGKKQSHWMWFVFPQLTALGQSATAKTYGIDSLEEAKAYLSHPILGERLIKCSETVLGHSVSGKMSMSRPPNEAPP